MRCVIRSEKTRRRAVIVAQMLGIAAVYYASGQLGLLRQVEVQSSVVTPLWPPSGIAVAALLYLGARIWPGIAIGALVTVLSMSDGPTFWGSPSRRAARWPRCARSWRCAPWGSVRNWTACATGWPSSSSAPSVA